MVKVVNDKSPAMERTRCGNCAVADLNNVQDFLLQVRVPFPTPGSARPASALVPEPSAAIDSQLVRPPPCLPSYCTEFCYYDIYLTMDKTDLETYQVQLSQVELALSADTQNAELISLRSELKELIDLTQAAIDQQAAAASASSSKAAEASKKAAAAAASSGASSSSKTLAAGDECLAKYSGDGQWYPARIASVSGSADNRQYSVVFKVYNNTELVSASQIKPLPSNHNGGGASSGAGGGGAGSKRKLSKVEEEEREKKKKKNEKKVEVRAAKAKEQQEKQVSWQKFAKKSERKGIHIAGVAGSSIFKTPDNPLGRGAHVLFVIVGRVMGR